jgi:organic radical activating enzyme
MSFTQRARRIAKLSRLFITGIPKYAVGSIDVTNRCNLRCEHCYFFAEDHSNETELSIEKWVEKLEAMKADGHPMMLCTWVGGEPMVRKELIDAGRIYQKIKQNVIDHSELSIQISCVLTSITKDCVEDLIKEWGPLARGGIIFDFFTPVTGLDEALWLDWPARDALIDQILVLKKKYPGVINMMDSTLELMRSNKAKQVTDNCEFRLKAFALGPTGEPKGKCMMGDNADCDRCGCVVPFHMATLSNRRLMIKENIKRFAARQ